VTGAAATRSKAAGRTVPGWLAPATLGLSVLGLLVALYLTYEHFTQNATLACSASGVVNCQKVTESPWSTFVGVPVAVLGVVFFAVMALLCRPRLFHAAGRSWDVVRLAWCGVGLAFALYLVWAELFHIGAICLWCTAVHVVTFLLFVALLFGQVLIEPAPRGSHGRKG
jgi:uncharacterized membrane protein